MNVNVKKEYQQYKIKFKMLAYGFPLTAQKYIVDNFELKSYTIDEKRIAESVENDCFDTTGYITTCSYQLKDDVNRYCNYFETVDFIDIDVPITVTGNKLDLATFIINNDLVNRIIKNFTKKLRLIYNFRIIFPIYKITIYDCNEVEQTYAVCYNDLPANIGLDKFDKNTFEKNGRYDFRLDSLIEIEKRNVPFSRAMDLFSHSFEPKEVPLRFMMLFSSLEALFVDSRVKITKRICICVSRILQCENIEQQNQIYSRIKELYDYRSRYIHGKENLINLEVEKELRGYVREVLIIYWTIALDCKYDATSIIKTLTKNQEFGINIKLLGRYLRSDDYNKTYKESCEMIASEITKGNIGIKDTENGIVKSVIEVKKKK